MTDSKDNKNYTELKYCKQCDSLHTLDMFQKHNKHEYQYYCKNCRNEYNRIYKQNNKYYFKIWYENNKDRITQYRYNRKRLELTQKVKDLKKTDWEQILEYFNYKCAYCNTSMDTALAKYKQTLHREHLVSIQNGGNNILGNIVPACKSCNSSKANRDWEEWYTDSDRFNLKNYNKIINYRKKYLS